ncbi:MAG: hypothetical protein K8I29_01375 [Alphaproteobacteria bacterium]|uniref:Uncharacterized protein n=1 Tax=Candidatus Nitrobium versatile TaxID=2884831 RepID=A0A953J966_9BACT|nr:hypothetical protein [Candidatus Nitrobium versatile]
MRRSSFLYDLGREIGSVIKSFEEGKEEVAKAYEKCDFFSSYETSYSLTLAYPDDILVESARRMGIDVEGREKLAIVKEMFDKSRTEELAKEVVEERHDRPAE